MLMPRDRLVEILIKNPVANTQTWPVQDAKARFSYPRETSLSEGPLIVTKQRKATAVLVPIRRWDTLQIAGKRPLKEILPGATGPTLIAVHARGSLKLRRD